MPISFRVWGGPVLLGALWAPACSLLNDYDPDAVPTDRFEETTEEACGDGADNDLDGRIDCQDHECARFAHCREDSPPTCSDGEDNDLDGRADCLDDGCAILAHCLEASAERCADGVDNDMDEATDCEDSACRTYDHCLEESPQACSDGIDNDRDGADDCADPACMGFELCREGSDPSCADASDNDRDGYADCADPDCYGRFACFPSSPLVPVRECEAVRPRPWFHDGFDGGSINLEAWRVSSTDDRDRPGIVDGALAPNGRDGWDYASVTSSAWFPIGARYPLDLRLLLWRWAPDGSTAACPADDRFCATRIVFHTRDVWQDGATDGRALLGVSAGFGAAPGVVTVGCGYLDRLLNAGDISGFRGDRGGPLEVRLQVDAEARKAVWWVEGREVCRSPVLPDAAGEARLAIYSGRGPAAQVVVDDLSVAVHRERRAEECRGVREPLLPDRFCQGRMEGRGDWPHWFYSGGTLRPRVARRGVAGGGVSYHLLFLGWHGRYHAEAGHASSPDGRTGWEVAPENEPLFEPHIALRRLGALLFDEEEGRLETWAQVKDRPCRRYVYTEAAQAAFEPLAGEVRLSVPAGAFIEPEWWAPETVLRTPEGYDAWFAAVLHDGRQAIFLATSGDGLAWTAEAAPALAPGEVDAWDGEGVRDPSVFKADEYYIMAFAGTGFAAGQAIGLAASRDGREWVEHGANPVLVGDPDDFDDAGVGGPALLVEDDVLRLWYEGRRAAYQLCPDNPLESVNARPEIGLVELRFDDTPRGPPAQ